MQKIQKILVGHLELPGQDFTQNRKLREALELSLKNISEENDIKYHHENFSGTLEFSKKLF